MEVPTGTRVRVDGLKARPELNGSLGTVTGVKEDSGRFLVMVDDMREALALKVDALTVAEEFHGLTVGMRVRVAGLDKRPELNGKVGSVEGFQGDRVNVYVDAIREKVALKPSVLAFADSAADASEGSADNSKQVRVECDGVALKLTLSAKQLTKPLAEAVLKPFLKAYAKKKGIEPPDVKNVSQVTPLPYSLPLPPVTLPRTYPYP